MAQWAELKGKPLGSFRPLYRTLQAPDPAKLNGLYRGEFVGPRWLRSLAPIGLALAERCISLIPDR